MLLPGLLAAGIGSLISIGMGSMTGFSTSAYALGALTLPRLDEPALADFAWTFLLAVGVAVFVFAVMRLGLLTWLRPPPPVPRPARGRRRGRAAGGRLPRNRAARAIEEVLFSGQEALPGLAAGAGTWSIGALLLVLALQGPRLGHLARQLPRRPDLPGAVHRRRRRDPRLAPPWLRPDRGGRGRDGSRGGLGAAPAALLRDARLASWSAKAAPGSEPLIIVGVVVAYLVTVGLGKALDRDPEPAAKAAPA